MNSFTGNPNAAQRAARGLISEQVAHAEARTDRRVARDAARRARRAAARRTDATARPDLPAWAVRFLFPMR
jgi:hypothetical protein